MYKELLERFLFFGKKDGTSSAQKISNLATNTKNKILFGLGASLLPAGIVSTIKQNRIINKTTDPNVLRSLKNKRNLGVAVASAPVIYFAHRYLKKQAERKNNNNQ